MSKPESTPTETEVSDSPAPSPLILDSAYEIWAVYMQKFCGGEIPPRTEFDRRLAHKLANPELGQPFEDCAIQAAMAVHKLRSGDGVQNAALS